MLFHSLAAHAGPKAIGVVLSGSLDDGSRGLAAIHRAHGVTMVLTPERGPPAGMPENAIDYDGPINVIGSPTFIAGEIGRLLAKILDPAQRNLRIARRAARRGPPRPGASTRIWIEAILEAIEGRIYTAATKDRLLALEARQLELTAMAPPQPAPRIHPNLAEVYRRKVERLEEALNEPEARGEAAEALRALIDRIVLTPGEARGEMRAELHGERGAILALGEAGIKNRTPSSGVRLSVVAGAGFETYFTEPQRIPLLRAA